MLGYPYVEQPGEIRVRFDLLELAGPQAQLAQLLLLLAVLGLVQVVEAGRLLRRLGLELHALLAAVASAAAAAAAAQLSSATHRRRLPCKL